MRSTNRIQRTRIVVFVLAGYVLLQFVWWALSLQRFNGELRDALIAQGVPSETVDVEYTKRWWMIFGEGTVFLILLLLGIGFLLRFLSREKDFQNRQTEFLAMFTHELKSPIASIRLALQTLWKNRARPESREALFAAAVEETRRLEGLTDKILQSSRLTLDPTLWANEPVDFSSLCQEVVDRFKLRPGADRLDVSIAPGIWVQGDAVALTSVLTNLLENAMLHTPPNTPFLLQLEASGSMECTLVVADHGPGIPDADKARVFRRFVRRAPDGQAPQKGSGLGLFLVRGLVELHSGSVHIEDADPTGTRFIITLRTQTYG